MSDRIKSMNLHLAFAIEKWNSSSCDLGKIEKKTWNPFDPDF